MYDIGQLLSSKLEWCQLIIFLGDSGDRLYPYKIYNFSEQAFDEVSSGFFKAFKKVDNA